MHLAMYGAVYPHIAGGARALGVINTRVDNVCNAVAKEVKYSKPTIAQIKKGDVGSYLAGLERHITKVAI